MENIVTEEMILSDLITSCKRLFGFSVREAVPIKRGWLNLKWKITTDSGVFLIKQYNKERYKLYNHDELLLALSQQMHLHGKGLPCPRPCSSDGKFLFESDQGELFMVMEYCNGIMISPGNLNVNQMYDLGRVTGRMHWLLNDGTLGMKKTPEFIPPSPGVRLSHWEAVLNSASESSQSHLLPVLETQYKVTEAISLKDFNLNQTGWAHRDLWVDNLLFKDNKVDAVLDFDRMKFDYPQLDVARAVVSGALGENGLDVSCASAFIKGHCENYSVEKGFLTNALKLLWYMESAWWINPEMDQHSVSSKRFAKEMIWLSENYTELEEILENI